MDFRELLPDREQLHAAPCVRNAFVVVLTLWLIGWYWAIDRQFAKYVVVEVIAVEAPMFAGVFASGLAGLVVLGLPVLSIPVLLACRLNVSQSWALAIATIFLGCSVTAQFHVASFGSARYFGATLGALWLFWLALQFERPAGEIRVEAQRLAKVMIAVTLLGAGVGKLTSGYWSGAVLYDIYFQHADTRIYPWLRSVTTDAQLMTMATFHSRLVVVVECGFVLLVWLRFRYFAGASVVVVLGIYLSSGPTVAGVVLPMAATAIGCFFLSSKAEHCARRSRSFSIIFTAYMIIGLAVVSMSVSPALQRIWMKQYHLSEENRVVWTLLRFVPKMYSFENHWSVRDAAGSTAELTKDVLPCNGNGNLMVPHYSARIFVDPLCYQYFFDYEQPITVELRSRYRSTCLVSRLQVEAIDDEGLRRVEIRPVETSSDCQEW